MEFPALVERPGLDAKPVGGRAQLGKTEQGDLVRLVAILLNIDAAWGLAYDGKNLKGHVGLLHAGQVHMSVVMLFQEIAVPQQHVTMEVGYKRERLVEWARGTVISTGHLVHGLVDVGGHKCEKGHGTDHEEGQEAITDFF